VRNNGERTRHLSATFYAEWVLGSVRENAPLQVVSDHRQVLCWHAAWAGDFAKNIAFLAADPPPRSVTADRTEFLPVPRFGVCCPAAGRVVFPATLFTLDPVRR
jgi:cellobiose phosphorylase